MRWRRNAGDGKDVAPDRGPVVLPVTETLNRQTVLELSSRLEKLEPGAEIVVDLTTIPGFDTDGTETLLDLQESRPAGQLSIVGFRQAAARLVGDPGTEPAATPERESGWGLRRLRNLVVVQAAEGASVSTDGLEPVLRSATAEDAAIIVVDLLGIDTLTQAGLQAIAFASSDAALHGQELLVVNVSVTAADLLRWVGLSATTYVAPEPLLDSSTAVPPKSPAGE
jgi:anti-anti-sigma regulatory factor